MQRRQVEGAKESKHGRVQEGQGGRARSRRCGGLDRGLDFNLEALGSQGMLEAGARR